MTKPWEIWVKHSRLPRMPEPKTDPLLAALHLASPALPVGGFAYSQGLEQAVEDRWVTCMDDAHVWIRDVLLLNLARQELPLWLVCHRASMAQDWALLRTTNDALLALRETAEFRLESIQMGHSMAKLFAQWPGGAALAQAMQAGLTGDLTASRGAIQWVYVAAHAALSAVSGVEETMALTAYLWSWVENQVVAAVKIVPLGQIDGQTLLHRLKGSISQAIQLALDTPDQDIGSGALGLAIASCRHESQYSRLFRS